MSEGGEDDDDQPSRLAAIGCLLLMLAVAVTLALGAAALTAWVLVYELRRH